MFLEFFNNFILANKLTKLLSLGDTFIKKLLLLFDGIPLMVLSFLLIALAFVYKKVNYFFNFIEISFIYNDKRFQLAIRRKLKPIPIRS